MELLKKEELMNSKKKDDGDYGDEDEYAELDVDIYQADEDEMFRDSMFKSMNEEANGRMSKQMARNRAHRGTFVGTSYWVSPEMLNDSVSGPFVDLWALGVIIYEMITG